MTSPTRSFLLTYNPDRFDFYAADVPEMQAELDVGVSVGGRWSVGSRTGGIGPGDLFYLLQQGNRGRGLVASGVVTSEAYQDEHFDPDHDGLANYVDVSWVVLVDQDAMLPLTELQEALPQQYWSPQGSGHPVRPEVEDDLAAMWAEHVGRAVTTGKAPASGRGGQGRVLDAKLRKQVEDAAQDRLMSHFEDEGWHVEDRRFAGSYDALATKGEDTLYLEAKGTTRSGDSVIVTRNEVVHARRHRDVCVLGILSNLRLDKNGDIDPASGDFWVGPFDPDDGELSPISYDFSPSWEGFTAQ